ncbi:MAG: hypothetical protein ACI9CE_000912 [Flavobacterium sp.]|jgi:hypothetical protein
MSKKSFEINKKIDIKRKTLPDKRTVKYQQINVLTKRLCIRPLLLTDYENCALSHSERLPVQNEFDEVLFDKTIKKLWGF